MEGTTELKSIFWIGTTVMLFFASALIFIVLFYKNYFFRMKEKETALLLEASLESEKKERQRIAADLHDSVSSDLSALRNYISILTKEKGNSHNSEVLLALKSGIEEAIENTRLISYKLMPPLLETTGLSSALTDFFQMLSQRTPAQFISLCETDCLSLNKSEAYELFRIVQEFTTNMLKYGRITQCFVRIYENGTFLYLELTDDGVPYNFSQSSLRSKGTGLKNISSRLQIINATLAQPDTASGNHFIISLPVGPIT